MEMNVGNSIRMMTVVLLATAGCDALQERPGHDFAAQVLDEDPLAVVGQIYAPVHFAVNGCSEFDVSIKAPMEGTSYPLSFTSRADGTFEAAVPVALMRPTPYCIDADGGPAAIEETLEVTCRDAGRTAQAKFMVAVQPAFAWVVGLNHVRAVFPSVKPWPALIDASDFGQGLFSTPFRYPQAVEESGLFDPWSGNSFQLNGAWSPWPNGAGVQDPLIRPRLAQNGDRGFVTLGCAGNVDCPTFPIAAGGPGVAVTSERLAEFDLADPAFLDRIPPYSPRGVAQVPRAVVDMAYAPDGSLVVVSQVGELVPDPFSSGTPPTAHLQPWARTIVTRVAPAPDGSAGVVEDAVTVIGDFPRETVQTRLSRTASGALAFAAFSSQDLGGLVSVSLHVTDGSTVTTSYSVETFGWVAADGSVTELGRVHLSPDASTLILSTRERGQEATWSMNADPSSFGSHQPFPAGVVYNWSLDSGAVWLPGAVALWTGRNSWDPTDSSRTRDSTEIGRVQVFDDTPPHALRWEYQVYPLPGAPVASVLVGATAVGDKLVLTTSTGVRILGPDGKLVGGSDPFPCGLLTTAEAAQVGPTTVAVGAGSHAYVFDVGGATAPGVRSE
jgi:hypothetical protein